MTRPLRALIDISALKHNFSIVRNCAPQSLAMAVVKANGYGHGMLRVANALENAEGFALLNIEEAVTLREAGFNQTILLLEGFFEACELPELAAHSLSTVVHCPEQIEMLEASSLKRKLNIFLKINSGMNRLGFKPEVFNEAMHRLVECPAVGDLCLMTHFATADEAQGIAPQMACFNRVTSGLDAQRSLANSAAIIRYPETHADWVRPGIMLYGSSPFADVSAECLGLKPVMTLESQVIAVQEIKPGEAIGYGASFRSKTPMRVGIVACGYADGYPRHAPSGTPVLVGGVRSCTLGRVSMDMICIDLSSIHHVGIGSPVIFWGDGLSVDEVAKAAGTISYELLCKLTQRVPVVEV